MDRDQLPNQDPWNDLFVLTYMGVFELSIKILHHFNALTWFHNLVAILDTSLNLNNLRFFPEIQGNKFNYSIWKATAND